MKNSKGKEIDPLFDGHPEKSIDEMTPTEKIEYLKLFTDFKAHLKDLKIIKKEKFNG